MKGEYYMGGKNYRGTMNSGERGTLRKELLTVKTGKSEY